MSRIEVAAKLTHCTLLVLREWKIKEFRVESVRMDPGGIKSGRRTLIRKGVLATDSGGTVSTIDQSAVALPNEETLNTQHDVVVKLVNHQYASRSEDPERRLKLLEEV